jgi:WD40 repeat protein/serine/threonine protein kinase
MVKYLDRIGQQVGDYRLLRWLGGGGFGNVYLAQQIRSHPQVAVKLLNIRLSHSEELKAFINEARTMRLKHAHIVPLLDFGISREEIPFLVMEYASGGTLRDRYPQGSQVPLPQVVNYAQQVSSALQYAHEQGLIHRDVKPENMLLRVDGTVLLSDFGLVAVGQSSDSLSPLQEIGGTLPYMAPEQIQGQAIATSDQYSLGVVVYEWIAGRRPFEGTTTEIATQHVTKPPLSLVELVPWLPSAVEEVVLKALAKDPKDRFATVQDFTTALEEMVRQAPNPLQSLPQAQPSVYNIPPIDSHEQASLPCTSNLPVPSSYLSPTPGPHVDWGDALVVPIFYGREQELALLSQWVMQERSQVVSVLGMGGIGKSALVISATHRLSEHFKVVIVRSLRDAPSCEALLDDCLQVLSSVETAPCACLPATPTTPSPVGTVRGSCPPSAPTTLEERINLLVRHLHNVRTLVVLDNLEGLLQAGDTRGHFRPGFEGYGQLLQRVAETTHQSCLLLTSREKPADLRGLSSRYPSIRSLRLTGLDAVACKQLLEEKEVIGTPSEQESLIEVYGGNPLALKMVAETIVDLFGGKIGPFLAGDTVIFGSITDLLDEQFARLSALEQTVLYWLAIMREPVTLAELSALLVSPPPRVQILEAVDASYRRSLIEQGKRPGSFTLQSVVLEYVTTVLFAQASTEILQGQLDKLIQYGLSQAQASEYVRQTQERLLVSPLLAEMHNEYQERTVTAEEQLLCLLDQLRKGTDSVQGYGPANLITLLRLQRGHLSGLDLSHLSIRGAYLQSTEMHETSLCRSLMRDTVFTEATNATWAMTISPDGTFWASGSTQGKVRVWDEESQSLRLIWQAHTDIVQALALSPDGRTLASGSADGTVKLWDLEACSHGTSPSDALLWTGWQQSPQSLTFSPDGDLLASGGLDATIRLWKTGSHEACTRGTNLQTLTHSGHVFAVVFSPNGRLLASGCSAGEIRLWERQKTASATYVQIFQLSTNWVTSLAFGPDSRTLVSAHRDQTIKLWEIEKTCRDSALHLSEQPSEACPHEHLLHTLPGQTNRTNRVAWSADGRTLASCNHDQAIWLWDTEQHRCRTVLHGHTDEVYQLAFTPDSNRLLSGSADNTLRVWDVKTGQCVRTIQGYAISFYDLDWSPNGTNLISGGTDGVVIIWDVNEETPPRVLRGHTRVVSGVSWSSNGKYLSSCGWDSVVRLWNPTTHACVHMFEDPSTMLTSVAWSPDGSLLACGTYQRGVLMWDVTTHTLRWVRQTHLIISHVAWSPNGMQLVGTGNDSHIYLWEGTDGTLQGRLEAHQGRIMSVVWSPDGTQLASSGDCRGSGELFVWDVQSGKRVRTFASNVVSALAWAGTVGVAPCSADLHNPHGFRRDLLISGGCDGTLCWWDVETTECVSKRTAHQGMIRSLKVSPDGKWLASCGDDGAITIWNLRSCELVRTLRLDRPYERMNITGIRGLTEAQYASLRALGAIG